MVAFYQQEHLTEAYETEDWKQKYTNINQKKKQILKKRHNKINK